MLKNAFFIARKDVEYILREWQSLLWLFVMPIIFFYFIGTVTSRFGGSEPTGPPPAIAVEPDHDVGLLESEILRRLEEDGYQIVHSENRAQFVSHTRRLVFSEDFTRRALEGEQGQLRFIRKNSGLSQQHDDVRVTRAVYTVLADLIAADNVYGRITTDSFRELGTIPKALTLTVSPAGKRQHIPTGFEQAIPGIMVMFTMLVLLTSGAVMLVIEREQGLLRRLASAPIPRAHLVLGKWGGKLALGLIQLVFSVLVGTVLFGMDWGPNRGMIAVVLLSWAALCGSLGLLLGCLARTEGQAVGIGVLTGNLLAALGGCWWPIEITPQWAQKLAMFLPTGWAMDAMHRLISFQAGAASVIHHVALILVAALAIGVAAVRVFRYE